MQYVSSTYRVESDQKDLIIKALRGDHDALKKNEGDYYKLHEQYKQLQHRYKLLSDEKVSFLICRPTMTVTSRWSMKQLSVT